MPFYAQPFRVASSPMSGADKQMAPKKETRQTSFLGWIKDSAASLATRVLGSVMGSGEKDQIIDFDKESEKFNVAVPREAK